jgi:hypothetical protein
VAKGKRYRAAREVAIGYPEQDPDRPEGYNLVQLYDEGEEIDRVKDVENLEGLVAAGYLEEVEG